MDSKDPYNELCFYLKKISENKKMETAKQTGLVEFKTIETDLFKAFTDYIQLIQKHAMSTAVGLYTDKINLTTYILNQLSQEQINTIIVFLNGNLKRLDNENEWEQFKITTKKEACEHFCYCFKTKGGEKNLATARNEIYYFSSTVTF